MAQEASGVLEDDFRLALKYQLKKHCFRNFLAKF